MAEEQREMTMWEKLAEPFNPDDLEWRVLQAKPGRRGGIVVQVFAYVTARAIHDRLDAVIGPANWCNTPQVVSTVDHTKSGSPILSVQVGISIRIGTEWVTKYNVSEATDIEAVKGAYSGAEKRAGEEWGIGRYLWSLGRLFAEATEDDPRNPKEWTYGKLADRNTEYWWKPPMLPTWAMPRDMVAPQESRVTTEDLAQLKHLWKRKVAPNEKNLAILQSRYSKLLQNVFGETPPDNPANWTKAMVAEVRRIIDTVKDGEGPSGDVPFE